ncbi:MAG: neutral/alkaline non-lysosomal ceramidase N-terminal domain-containing protein [Pirellulales bacterium]
MSPIFVNVTYRLLTTIGAILLLLACCVASPTWGAEPILAGVAESDITPPEKFPMAGYYHERLATGQRDPLKAKAVVLRQGETAVAWVVCDLTGVSRDLCVAVRREASAKTGIRPEHIVVSATHSHTAPDYTRDLYDYLGGVPQDSRRPAYASRLIQGAVDAIVRAHASARPAQILQGSAQQTTPVSFNRRFVMRDGSVRTWQRLDTPGVLRAAGPVDPEIGLMLIRDTESQQPRGLISNFALHLDTVGGLLWSGDYPFFIEQAVRRQLGDSVVSLFGAGTCGDINHSDPVAKERLKTDAIGGALASSILPTLPQLSAIDVAAADALPLQVRTTVVSLPLQEIAEEHLERAQKLIPAAKEGQKVEFFDLVSAYKAVVLDHLRNKPSRLKTTDYLSWGLSHEWAGVGAALPVEVTTVTLGREFAVVFLPGEVFVDLGLAIKRHSPFRTTLVVELSNCVETIYIPTRAAYAGGSYEVTNSNLQPGSGEMLVEAALKLLRESATTGAGG